MKSLPSVFVAKTHVLLIEIRLSDEHAKPDGPLGPFLYGFFLSPFLTLHPPHNLYNTLTDTLILEISSFLRYKSLCNIARQSSNK